MFKPQLVTQAARAISRPAVRAKVSRTQPANIALRTFSTTPRILEDDKHKDASTSSKPGASGSHEGQYARTDQDVRVEYPEEHELPRSQIVQGRGGMHYRRTLPSFSLEGRVAMITGGARGLGLVMAQALVQSGAHVAIIDLNKDEAQVQAEHLVSDFQKENPDSKEIPKVTAHYADVSSPDSVSAAVSEVISSHGKCDHLVTSAGFTENFDAINYPYERMKKLWGVNVDGTYLFATALARHLMDRKAPGSMVMIGSMSGSIVNVPQPQAPYNAAKAAVRHLAASLAVEWAHAGIRVNTISPGYMLTALTRKILDDNPDLKRQWTSLIPQGKMGNPEDLMGVVTFLLSDASAYMTGADVRVDGGYTLT